MTSQDTSSSNTHRASDLLSCFGSWWRFTRGLVGLLKAVDWELAGPDPLRGFQGRPANLSAMSFFMPPPMLLKGFPPPHGRPLFLHPTYFAIPWHPAYARYPPSYPMPALHPPHYWPAPARYPQWPPGQPPAQNSDSKRFEDVTDERSSPAHLLDAAANITQGDGHDADILSEGSRRDREPEEASTMDLTPTEPLVLSQSPEARERRTTDFGGSHLNASAR